ncbi:MAG TPA: hypothetical protein PK141_08720 [Polyangiaceae bacterium]|nr:hypothetical protein [Polyangiaceae bacterium]
MSKPRTSAPASSAPASSAGFATFAGDSHNFGRQVAIGETEVHKPRTLLWEWLVLGVGSPLRALLRVLAEEDLGDGDAFAFLPELRFSSQGARDGGTVERLDLAPLGALSPARKRELAVVVGRAIALFSWLGLSDLHWENLALGLDARERIVFAPLDVEIVFDDLALPTATKLLPEADPEYGAVNRHAAGVRRVLPFLGKPVDVVDLCAMVDAYLGMLTLLERHGSRIAEVFTQVPGLRDAPIRVLLRGTGDYVRARSQPVWPPLLGAEKTQLARGDIPYFFRLYGRAGIHYFVEPTLERLGRLPLKGDVPQLQALLPLAEGLRAPSRASLREEGLLAILGAFDHPSFTGTHTHGELSVTFSPRRLKLAFGREGDELVGKRDLRAYVESVYLPCACGEVSSPLVPAVTVCEPSANG